MVDDMARKQLRVILDDNTGSVTYGGGQWTLSTLVQWYQGTSNFPAFAQVGDAFGSLNMSFEGTSIAFIGNTPSQGLSQSATVSIDGRPAYTTNYGSATPPAYIQWYQSPTLADGKHTITIDRLDGTALDMVLITVGPNAPLAGTKIFVDNNDPALQYSGSWSESTDGFNAGTLPDGLPIGNSTQRTTKAGDTMTFQFSGTSISVYGIFSWANIGSISATYTLDGVDSSQSYPVTSSSPQHVKGDGEASNFLFFDKDNLSSGAHTLVLKITDIENQIFALDYLVYTPSFSSLATMPDLTDAPSTTPGNGSNSTNSTTSTGGSKPTTGGGSSTHANGSPSSDSPSTIITTISGVITTVIQTPSTETAIGGNQFAASSKSAPIGAIVGGVVGGVFVLIVAVFLFLYLRRLQRSKGNQSLMVEQRLVGHINSVSPPQMSVTSATRPSFGNSASSADATPFLTTTTPMAFASISDLKRDRFENDNMRREASQLSSNRGNATSIDNSQRNVAMVVAPSMVQTTDTDGLEYVDSDSVPPAYDALSTSRSSLSPVR